MFAPNSRYASLETLEFQVSGRTVTYVTRRFVPPPGQLQVIARRQLVNGLRLDQIAFDAFNDATLYWRVADGSEALDPSATAGNSGAIVNITIEDQD